MPTKPFDTSVIILNYRTPELTISCARSVLTEFANAGLKGELIIVDNASGDGSKEQIGVWLDTQKSPTVPIQLISAHKNGGFSYGNNQGIRNAKATLTLLLNSDTEVRPGCFSALMQAKHDNPNAAIIGAQLTSEDGARQVSRFQFISPLSEFVSAAGISIIDSLFPKAVVPIHLQSSAEVETGRYKSADWVSFAAVALDRALLPNGGLMDEGYFLYFEDTDLCQRAKKAGTDVIQAQNARVIHKRGGSGPVKANYLAGKRQPRYFYESRSRYLRLHYGGKVGLLCGNLGRYTGYTIALLSRLYKKRRIQSVASEWRDIWIGWRANL